MVYIPLVWFVFLFFIVFKKRGLDACAYTILMFIISSFCAVLGVNLHIFHSFRENPSFESTIIYCVLTSLTFIPIYRFNSKGIKNVIITNPRALDILTYFFFISLVFSLVYYFEDIVFRIAYGDWDELREMNFAGNGYDVKQLPGPFHFVSLAMNIFGTISYVMITVFFICLIYLKKKPWFLIMAISGSILSMISAILFIERARIFIWMLMLGLNIVVFWPMMNKKNKKFIIPIVGIIVSVFFIYSMSVTISRFGSKPDDEGTTNSIIGYFGQPYLNFCYFYENFNNKEGFTTKAMFPITHTLIIKDYIGGVDRQQELTAKSGIDCGVFYSFLGTFILDGNKIGPFVFVFVYLIVSSILMKKRKSNNIRLPSLFKAFAVIIVPTYGCIAYMYAHWYPLFATICLLFFLNIMCNKKTR